MRLTAKVKIQNGYLHQAVEAMGSQAALAVHLGVTGQQLGAWLNLKAYPASLLRDMEQHRAKWKDIEAKLLVLTGALLDDIFPLELLDVEFIVRPKSFAVTQDVSLNQLTGREQLLLATNLDDVDNKIDSEALHQTIDSVLGELKPNRAKVLRYRFGLDDGVEHTLDETAEVMHVTRERVRQIEVDALRKLRHPAISKRLEPMYEAMS